MNLHSRAFAALSCALACATAPLLAADAVIAEWNVACGVPVAGGGSIDPDRITRIGKTIAGKIRPDILVVSEVSSKKEATAIAAASTAAGWPLQFRGLPAQPKGCTQFLAILARPGVSTSAVRTIPKSEAAANPGTRRAIITKARVGKFDAYIVGVHFKSSRGSADRSARDGQCRTVADSLHRRDLATFAPEHDFLVLGDYNMIPGEDASNFAALNTHGRLRFISDTVPGTTHMGAKGCVGGKPTGNHLDGYAIANPATQEYVAKSIRILTPAALGLPCDAFQAKNKAVYVSDHFPLVARFRTDADDD